MDQVVSRLRLGCLYLNPITGCHPENKLRITAGGLQGGSAGGAARNAGADQELEVKSV